MFRFIKGLVVKETDLNNFTTKEMTKGGKNSMYV